MGVALFGQPQTSSAVQELPDNIWGFLLDVTIFTWVLIGFGEEVLFRGFILHRLLARRRGLGFRQTWLFCTLGYATHALLDACTTYGTMLLWPFSDERFAWNTISIIDPLFTVPLLVAVVLAGKKRRPLYARLGLVWACAYMAMGLWQRNEAMEMGYALAAIGNGASFMVGANPGGAGKTTVMGALLNLVPDDAELVREGIYLLFLKYAEDKQTRELIFDKIRTVVD